MAVAVAETAGLPIVARAAGAHPYVYAATEASGATQASTATAEGGMVRGRDGA